MPRANAKDLAARNLPAPRGLEGYPGGTAMQPSNDTTLQQSNTATVQPSNPDSWELASYKIRSKTKSALNSWVRRQQAEGAKITIGGQVDEVLSAWLREQGVEV